jgi:hypothetical protein
MSEPTSQADTIVMSQRESSLYNLGVLLGTAQGLATAATAVRGLAGSIREFQAARVNRDWCDQAAQNVRSLIKGAKGSKVKLNPAEQIANALEAFGKRLLDGQEDLAKMVEQLAVNIELESGKRKTEFAAVLPTIVDREPDKQPGPVESQSSRKLGKKLLEGFGKALLREAGKP